MPLRQVFCPKLSNAFLSDTYLKIKIQFLMKPPPKLRLSGLLDLSTLHLSAFTSEVVISTRMPLVLIISSWFPFLELLLTKSEAKWSFTSRDGVGMPFNFHFAFMLFLVSSGPAPPGTAAFQIADFTCHIRKLLSPAAPCRAFAVLSWHISSWDPISISISCSYNYIFVLNQC